MAYSATPLIPYSQLPLYTLWCGTCFIWLQMFRFPHMPPNYHPGMQRPPFMEQRFRGPPPPQRQMEGSERFQRPDGAERFQRPSIIKDETLRQFDEGPGPHDGGWAAAQLEMDFRFVASLYLDVDLEVFHFILFLWNIVLSVIVIVEIQWWSFILQFISVYLFYK